MNLSQNTEYVLSIGPLVDADGITPKTGLAHTEVTITLRKAGNTTVTKILTSDDWVEDGDGYYRLIMDEQDTDTLGQLKIAVSTTGIVPYCEEHEVVPKEVLFDVITDAIASSEIIDKIRAAVHGSYTITGNVITLDNGDTFTIVKGGRITNG